MQATPVNRRKSVMVSTPQDLRRGSIRKSLRSMRRQQDDFRTLMLRVHAKSQSGQLDPTDVVHNWQVIQDSLHGLPEEEEATVFRMFNNMPSLDRARSMQALARSRKMTNEVSTARNLVKEQPRSHTQSAQQLPKAPTLPITKRLTRDQMFKVRQGFFQDCANLRFFMEQPEHIRQELLSIAKLIQYPAGKVVFSQDDEQEDGYYVIVKGTVKIEKKLAQYRAVEGMPPMVVKICYDGDRFGEVRYFEKNIQDFAGQDVEEQMKSYHQEKGFFGNLGQSVTEKMTENLPESETRKLNKQSTTATCMEDCDLLYINRVQSMKVLVGGTNNNTLVERLDFISKVDLFKDINQNHLLPLISNIVTKKFRKGQYIQKEGSEPDGLTIIKEGSCLVCTDKLAIRRVESKHNPFKPQKTIKNEYWQKHPEMLQLKSTHERLSQNKIVFEDESGNKIPGNFVVYKDLMVFKELGKYNHFGGRCLLETNHMKNIKKQIMREQGLTSISAVNAIVEKQQQQQRHKMNRTKSEYIGQPLQIQDSARTVNDQIHPFARHSMVDQIRGESSRIQFADQIKTGLRQNADSMIQTHRIPTKTDKRGQLFKNFGQRSMIFDRSHPESVAFDQENFLDDDSRTKRQNSSQTAKSNSKAASNSVRMQKTADKKSNLSIIANSAVVEVWLVDEELLGLLPPEIKKVVLGRIKALQKEANPFEDPQEKAKKSRASIIKRVQELQKQEDSKLARSSFKYSRTGFFIDKMQRGVISFRNNDDYQNALMTVLERDMQDLPKNQNITRGPSNAERMVMERQKMVKTSQDCGCLLNCSKDEEAFTACKLDQVLRTEIHDDLEQDAKVLNHSLHQLNYEKKQERIARIYGSKGKVEQQRLEEALEEYGEADRPQPKQVINDIVGKFIDWDSFKMSILKAQINQ